MCQTLKLVRGVLAQLAVLLSISLAASPALAQLTEKQSSQILEELRGIRRLLEQQQRSAPIAAPNAPERTVVSSAAEGFGIGNKEAPLTLVEFTDIECPFCRTFHVGTYQQIKQQYIDTGRVRFVTRDLPLDFHRNARQAAHAARCAGE